MRLLKATVRNYRLHRETTVEFDPHRTLIGGPNETGKSTLIEAIHNALFLRAKTGGEIRSRLVSRIQPGHPEVELEFESGGVRYSISKRFSGQNGTATLTAAGGSSWLGDEAETELARLLGVEVLRGSNSEKQWGHLWVWQGAAGNDPAGHATEQRDSLVARLQASGGGAAMQSEFDAAVANGFAERHARIFTKGGDPKAGSELHEAAAEETSAAQVEAAAREAVERLDRSVADFRDAEQRIAESADAIEKLEPQQRDVTEKLEQVEKLRADERTQALALATAREKHEALANAEARLATLHRDLTTARTALAPMEEGHRRLTENESGCRESDVVAEAALQKAMDAVRTVRLRSEALRAHADLFEKTQRRDQLRQRMDAVIKARSELTALEKTLSALPALTESKLKTLQKHERDVSNAGAALEGMATGIEVLSADAEVKLGDRVIAPGHTEILSEEADLRIGDAIHLRIRPGGGMGLAEARQRERDLRDALARALDDCGFGTVAAAVEAVRRRQQAEAEVGTARARIESLDADAVERDFEKANAAVEGAVAEVARRSALVNDAVTHPADLSDAQKLHAGSVRDLDEAENAEKGARDARARAAADWKRASDGIVIHRAKSAKQASKVSDLEAQIRLMIETHGEDDARTKFLGESRAAKEQSEAAHLQTQQSLRELQPELLDKDAVRIARALEQHRAARNDAEQRRAVARSELQRDGSVDPQENLALAAARHESASRRLARAQRQADALKLLHDLFRQEQQSLARQFTQPLRERIATYLECLFGTGTEAGVELADNSFSGLSLTRPANPDASAQEFALLSGGAREQLAAAVRLAMAEILAEAHGGCLPVVFDDAFAYSDPERVEKLQRMLDHAANRGLQIIILTCTPADYAALGAATISLRS